MIVHTQVTIRKYCTLQPKSKSHQSLRNLVIMGGSNKRRRKSSKKAAASSPTADDTTKSNNGVRVYIESTTDVSPPPSAWSANFVQNIDKKTPIYSNNKDDDIIPSVMDIGSQMVKGTLERISSKRNKKARKSSSKDVLQGASSSDAKPTDVQLNLWPALLHSFQSKVNDSSSTNHHHLNVVGIAPTGTGKTLSYSIPIVSHCLHTLLSIPATNSTNSINVHGIILVPTRELASQVSKEMNVVAKVANKYIAKYYKNAATDDDVKEKKIESMAIYGGVDIETQIATLLGKGEEKESSCGHTSLVVAATAGRLLDILKQTNSEDESTVSSAASAFANLQAIVFDEADRIAVNTDMASQVDEILSILKSVRKDSSSSGDVVSCLVSATLPDKAKEMCEIWVPRNRIVVMVNSVKVGDNEKQSIKKKFDSDCNATKEDNDEESPKAMSAAEEEQGSKKRNNLDLSSIPSNIVQTLHVCSAHKKPKKLIVTLQRIYKPKHQQQQQQRSSSSSSNGERFSANNRLTIVFFKQIKTVKYVSQLLVKEGLKCAELYGSLPQSEREKRLLEFKAGKREVKLTDYVCAQHP